MRETNADQAIVGVRVVHPFGGICERTTMLEWGREQGGYVSFNDFDGWNGIRVDIVGQAALTELIPESIGLVRIMIARQ